jgi:hypothetical protein
LRAHEVLAGMSLHRVYWYAAPPLDTRVTKPLLGPPKPALKLVRCVPAMLPVRAAQAACRVTVGTRHLVSWMAGWLDGWMARPGFASEPSLWNGTSRYLP